MGVPRGSFLGFGCPKRHPDALLAKTMNKINNLKAYEGYLFSLQFANKFGIDITDQEMDQYLQDVVVTNGIMAHQIGPDPVSDNALINALSVAFDTVSAEDVSKMLWQSYKLSFRLIFACYFFFRDLTKTGNR